VIDVADMTRSDITFELLRQTVSMYDVVELLGYELDASNKIVSPFNPNERTPSAHVYEDHLHDFSTGWHGDIVDLVAALNPDMKKSDIIWKLWNKAIRAGREPGDVEREQPRELVDFTDHIDGKPVYVGFLNKTKPPYGAVLANYADLWVPHRDGDLVYGVKVRLAGGGKSALPGSQFGHKLYHPWGWRIPPREKLVLCEGESDAWAFNEVLPQSWDVLALPSGAGTWKDHWLKDIEHISDVRVCMDNDRAGRTAEAKLLSKIGHGRALPLRVPQLYNDAREAIEAGWKPSL